MLQRFGIGLLRTQAGCHGSGVRAIANSSKAGKRLIDDRILCRLVRCGSVEFAHVIKGPLLDGFLHCILGKLLLRSLGHHLLGKHLGCTTGNRAGN